MFYLGILVQYFLAKRELCQPDIEPAEVIHIPVILMRGITGIL